MNATSEDIKDLLDGASCLTLTFPTNLCIGEIPDGFADECVCIIDTGGDSPEVAFTYEYPSAQIVARGKKGDYLGAHNLVRDVMDYLVPLTSETINGARYIGFWQQGGFLPLGFDENHRPRISVNVRMHRTTE